MILSRQQQIVTAFLAVLIVASVISMPRAMETPARESRPMHQASGMVVPVSAATELAQEPVKDLTYN